MERRPYLITAVERTLGVLNCFSVDRPALTLMEIVAELGGHKGTVYRMVSTLVELGYLEMEEIGKRYSLGPRVLSLGHIAAHTVNLRTRALPHLRRLFERVQEHVNLSVLHRNEVLFVERFQSPFFVGMNITSGTRLPIHVSSMGKVMTAHLPRPERDRLVDGIEFKRFTERTITDREAFQAELDQVRAQGYALNDEELENGLVAIAAPVWGWDGTVKAAINVTGPTTRLAPDYLHTKVRPLLLETARAISAALGASAGAMTPGP